MNKNNYSIKYLLNELSNEEKREFEKLLAESSELRNQLSIEKSKLDFINTYTSVEADNRYFTNIYPRFLQRLDEEKSTISVKNFSAGFSFALMILLMLTFGINNGLRNSFDSSLTSSENEILSFLELTSLQSERNSFNINYEKVDNQTISDTYFDQIDLELSEIKNYISVNNIDMRGEIQNLDDDEFESIYENLSEFKIL
jgi:hypothetical protein